jgi:hypothetical protein
VLAEAISRPSVRAEAVLDGVFAQAVVVVEGEGDRVVYQATWETLIDEFRADVHFSTVGGTGGIADTCRLYRTLDIPVAVIADLDMLVDTEKMARVLGELVKDVALRGALLTKGKEVAEELRNVPPRMRATEVEAELTALARSPMDWAKGDDLDLKHRVGRLRNTLDRLGRLKKGGVREYSSAIGTRLSELLARLQLVGLFLVPVGELEGWLADEELDASRESKWAWANAAAERILQSGRKEGDIWNFLSAVGHYLISPARPQPAEPLNATGADWPPG